MHRDHGFSQFGHSNFNTVQYNLTVSKTGAGRWNRDVLAFRHRLRGHLLGKLFRPAP